MNNPFCVSQLQNSSSTTLQVLDPLYSVLIANIVINGFLCYPTIMMNTVTIHALRKTSSLPKPLKTLLLSLAVSDLVVGTLGQPLYIALLVDALRCNDLNESLTWCAHICLNVLYVSSFSSITVLSADRYLAIQMPLRYQEIVTYKRVITVVIAIWILSASSFLLIYAFPIYIIMKTVSFIATAWCSCKVYLTARHHNIQIQAETRHIHQNSAVENIARLRKSAQGTFWLYLVFWVCYLPNFSVNCFIHFAQAHESAIILPTLKVCCVTLVLLNSSLNPVIYCWKMRHIRQTIMDIFRNIVRNTVPNGL